MQPRAVTVLSCSRHSTSPTARRAEAPSSSTEACAILAQGNFGLVREALHERGILLRNAPHLVHCREFVVPAYNWFALPYYGIGLKIYDWMSGRLGLGRSRWVSASGVAALTPAIREARLHGGIVYADGQFDDARLAITLARTFVDLGGTALNYVKVTGFTRREGRIAEVVACNSETGEELRVGARRHQCCGRLRRRGAAA